MIKCKKCGFLKVTEGQKCHCNAKPKKEKEPKPIKQISDKKAKQIKERGSLKDFYAKLSKNHFNEYGDGFCEYCGVKFNIENHINNLVCFAHILSKGDPLYKHLAVFKNNVAIVCSENCHTDMDAEICIKKLKPTLKLLIEAGEKVDVSDLNKYL